MTTKKVPGVDDLGDVMRFWSLKEQIFDDLLIVLRLKNTVAFTEDSYQKTANLMHKIESLGKKENNNGKR